MAYNSRNLSVLAYANGFTLWHYSTPDPATTVDTTGYFNAAADMFRVGDMILANVNTAATPDAGVFVVRSNSAGAVNVSDLTPLGATDTD
ncbi:MAG: hypothetical protein EA405_07910 [Rhodospirillales bacterium]|nr:MAG: hypothetical protein EA405_07910 [Rhodospirillales bacterium]